MQQCGKCSKIKWKPAFRGNAHWRAPAPCIMQPNVGKYLALVGNLSWSLARREIFCCAQVRLHLRRTLTLRRTSQIYAFTHFLHFCTYFATHLFTFISSTMQDVVTLCTLGVGTSFGEAVLSGRAHSVSVVTNEPCTLLRVRRDDFAQLWARHAPHLEAGGLGGAPGAPLLLRAQSVESTMVEGGGDSSSRSSPSPGAARFESDEGAVPGALGALETPRHSPSPVLTQVSEINGSLAPWAHQAVIGRRLQQWAPCRASIITMMEWRMRAPNPFSFISFIYLSRHSNHRAGRYLYIMYKVAVHMCALCATEHYARRYSGGRSSRWIDVCARQIYPHLYLHII